MRVTVKSKVVGVLLTVPKAWKKSEGIGNQKKNRDYSDHIIVKIG